MIKHLFTFSRVVQLWQSENKKEKKTQTAMRIWSNSGNLRDMNINYYYFHCGDMPMFQEWEYYVCGVFNAIMSGENSSTNSCAVVSFSRINSYYKAD